MTFGIRRTSIGLGRGSHHDISNTCIDHDPLADGQVSV